MQVLSSPAHRHAEQPEGGAQGGLRRALRHRHRHQHHQQQLGLGLHAVGGRLQPFFSGIALDVTPQIDDAGNVMLHVHPSISTVSEKTKKRGPGLARRLPAAAGRPAPSTKTDSIVRVKDGQIVAIGGLMKQETRDERTGVTGMAQPAGGGPRCFRQTQTVTSKRELVILLKPSVIHENGNWPDATPLSDGRARPLSRSPAPTHGPAPKRIRLGDLLIQEALITATQLDEALADQKKTGRKLGRVFIERGWVTEVQIAKAIARQLRAPFVELNARAIKPEVGAPAARGAGPAPARAATGGTPAPRCAWRWPTPPTWPPTTSWPACSSARWSWRWWPKASCWPCWDRAYANRDEIAGLARETHRRHRVGGRRDRRPARLFPPARRRTRRWCGCSHRCSSRRCAPAASDIHIEPQEKSAAHPLPHRRRAARADRGRRQDRRRGGAAAEADERAGHLRKAPAAGRPLPRQAEVQRGGTCASPPCPTQHGESVVMRLPQPRRRPAQPGAAWRCRPTWPPRSAARSSARAA